MKKIIAILGIGIIWCFLPMLVKAYTPPSTLAEIKTWYASYGYTNIDSYIESLYNNGNVSDKAFAICRPNDYQTGTQKVIIFVYQNKNGVFRGQTSGSDAWIFQEINGTNQSYSSVFFVLNYDFTNHSATKVNEGSGSGFMIAGNGAMASYNFHLSTDAPQINFDDIYYSPQIPIPDIDVFMDSSNPYPSAGDAIWNATIEIGDNSDYYVQWGYKMSWPTYIDVGLSGVNGDITYNYYGYLSSTYTDIVDMQSLTTAIAQGASASTFQPMWESFYEGLSSELGLPEFGSSVNAMSQTMINNAKQYYIDYMMTQIPMYGNRLEVFARYFIVDSDNNNRVVVGAWNHWSSKDGSRTKERPTNYIDNVALPGYINSSNNVELQDNSSSYDSLGNSTGVPATIINNNYVPNYPDYPTIASYNKDNLLVSSIDKLNEVKGFFGEFNDFLNVTFVWVPDWIWALIGIGFSLSIIVFFLRML